jgi:gliding motility-associated-like protein
VVHKATGCNNIDNKNIASQLSPPKDPTVEQVDVTCSDSDSGSASASIDGVVTGYKFEWSEGSIAKPVADFTGPVYNNLGPKKYTVVATNNTTQCSSKPVIITIKKTVNPTVTASVVSHQTSCDVSKPNGSASALADGKTSGYKFEWFFGQNTLPANRVDTTNTAKGLKVGTYTVKATNKSTGCSDTEEVTINFAVVTPAFSNVLKANATRCDSPDGSITVSVTPGVASDYKFSWYKGDVAKSSPDFPDTIQTLSGLSAGTYTVTAKFRARHCEITPLKVVIDNTAPAITMGAADIHSLPSDCDDDGGSMSVTVSAPGNTLGFDFEWRRGQEPFASAPITTVSNTSTTTRINSLTPDLYTLIVTNRNTGCKSSKPYVMDFAGNQVLSFVEKDDVEDCPPYDNTGRIKIKLDPADNHVEADYVIEVFVGKNDLGPNGNTFDSKTGAADNEWTNLEPQFYTFVAVSTNALTLGCRSVPVTVEIIQKSDDPIFALNSITNNKNCGTTAFTGQISLNIANPGDYSYAWHEGADATAPSLGTNTPGTSSGTTASNLPLGKYTVVVTKTGTPSKGCSSTATYQIYDNLPMLSIPQGGVKPTPITRCDQPGGGSAEITGVTENPGPTGNLNSYLFTWYDSNTSGPSIGTGITISNLIAGTYYVKATNPGGCSTDGLTEFTIEDNTMNTVNVELLTFTIPTRCVSPLAANDQGRLEVIASGVGSNFIYSWYEGQSATGPEIASTAEANNLNANLFYTVRVLNDDTKCSITKTFFLPEEIKPIMLAASAAPNTSCIDTQKDGSVFAIVTGGAHGNYDYDWFRDTIKPTADYSSTAPDWNVTGLDDATYIVVVTDKEDAGCTTTETVVVEDVRIYPVVTAEPLAPLTICDPARPDGVAAANVDGSIISHRFDWFIGAPPAGGSFYTGSQASNLAADSYSVIATDFVTGCSDTTQVSIDIKQLPIPIPSIDVLSMVTSCLIDNGALTASVDGNTSNYIFHWYHGTVEKLSSDFIGENYDSLATGPYSVTATSRITGCKSPLVIENIIDDPKFPDFSITTVPTICRENSLEPGTGSAALFMTNGVDSDSIIWRQDGMFVSTGPIATGLNVGTYEVTVISALGCETTKPVSIKTEIHPFNGVSRNGDGQNDVFHINCIESFPTNLVKIFNRAGTMVYEAEGYDNSGVVFDGQSNRGISILGNNLPAGTYFYIIDKKDGSKPLAGYLEIVN